uniref:Uncharacterized protein n=1 Tax=Amphimedon queenslandica TaxID=400682 RepID=A0A1X7U0S0_AMPQE
MESKYWTVELLSSRCPRLQWSLLSLIKSCSRQQINPLDNFLNYLCCHGNHPLFDATPLDHAQSAILIVFHRVSLCLSRALSRPASSIPFT